MADGRPWFLTVKLPSESADGGRLEALSKVCEQARGTVLVSAPVVAVDAPAPEAEAFPYPCRKAASSR